MTNTERIAQLEQRLAELEAIVGVIGNRMRALELIDDLMERNLRKLGVGVPRRPRRPSLHVVDDAPDPAMQRALGDINGPT
jgi:hypothetical protein